MQNEQKLAFWLQKNSIKLFVFFAVFSAILLIASFAVVVFLNETNLQVNFYLLYTYLTMTSTSSILFIIEGLLCLVYFLTTSKFCIENLIYIAKIGLAFNIFGALLGSTLAYFSYATFWIGDIRLILLIFLAILNAIILALNARYMYDFKVANIMATIGVAGVLFIPVIKYAANFFNRNLVQVFAQQINAMPLVVFIPLLLSIVGALALAFALAIYCKIKKPL